MKEEGMRVINVLNVPFHALTQRQVLEYIQKRMEADVPTFLTTPNPEIVVEAQKNQPYLETLQSADISIPDGMGILWASHFLYSDYSQKKGFVTIQAYYSLLKGAIFRKTFKSTLPERVTGVDMFQELCALAAKKGWSVYLLGAAPGVAEKVKSILVKKYPGIHVVGTFAGTPKKEDEEGILLRIINAKPDILFVAYGAPRQELWIKRNMKKMPSVKFAAGIGGSFDFVAGKQKRAPVLFQKIGMEWGWRLLKDPKRALRIYNATLRFISLIIKEKLV